MNGMQTPHVFQTEERSTHGLDPQVAAKVTALREAHAQAAALNWSVYGRLSAAQDRLQEAEDRRERYATDSGRRAPDQRWDAPEYDAQVAEAQAEVERLKLEAAKLEPLVAPAHRVSLAIDKILPKLVGQPPVAVAMPTGTPADWVDRVECIRTRVGELHGEERATHAMPVSFGEAKGRLEGFLDEAASRVDFGWFAQSFIAADPPVIDRFESPWMPPTSAALAFTNDPLSVTADGMLSLMLQSSDLRRRLLEALKTVYATRTGLSAADRASKLETIRAELHALEVEEEQHILALDHAAVPLARRDDVDAAVVARVVLLIDSDETTTAPRWWRRRSTQASA